MSFGVASFAFALAAFPGTGAAGVAHLAGGVLLLLVAFLQGLDRSELGRLVRDRRLWLSAVLLAATNALGASAVAYAELTTLAAMSQTAPLWAVLLAPWHGDRVSRSDLAGMVLALGGIALVIGVSLDGQLLGIGLALSGALLTALWTHQLGLRGRNEDPYRPAAWVGLMMLLGAPLLLLAQPGWPGSVSVVLYCALAGVLLALGNAVTLAAMRHTPAARTLLLKPLSALVSAGLGLLFLGDSVTLGLLAGGSLVLLSSWVIARGHRAEQPAPDEHRAGSRQSRQTVGRFFDR